MKPSDIQREVELTLASLDRLKKADAPVDFIETLTKRIIFSEEEIRWIKRTKVALAAMVAMAILNGIVMFNNQPSERDAMMNSIAQQYHLTGELIDE